MSELPRLHLVFNRTRRDAASSRQASGGAPVNLIPLGVMRRTRKVVPADIDELLEAIEWVSAGADFRNAAYICRNDGRTFWIGGDVEQIDDMPKDIEDGSLYLALPSKQQLGLGMPLAMRFTEEYLASDLREVRAIFSRRGAYQRFKDLLERRNRLEDWYRFESSEGRRAVATWAREHGFEAHNPEHNAANTQPCVEPDTSVARPSAATTSRIGHLVPLSPRS
jgi:hypothetical protein